VVPQQFTVHFEDLMSSDGVPLDFDAVVRLQVIDSVDLISNFGRQWFENNVQAEFSNRVRQAVRKHGMNETAIQTNAVDAIDAEVSKAMVDYIAQAKLPIRLIDVTVGRANPPDSIKSQRIETAAQEQRTNSEKQRKLAEDQRKEAEQARAASDNAYRNALGMSSEQFIQLEAIHAQRDVCLKGGCTMILGGGTPLVNVASK
jgi:regulator of protease activity HflC (stomatin/prohibitin superfamily)